MPANPCVAKFLREAWVPEARELTGDYSYLSFAVPHPFVDLIRKDNGEYFGKYCPACGRFDIPLKS